MAILIHKFCISSKLIPCPLSTIEIVPPGLPILSKRTTTCVASASYAFLPPPRAQWMALQPVARLIEKAGYCQWKSLIFRMYFLFAFSHLKLSSCIRNVSTVHHTQNGKTSHLTTLGTNTTIKSNQKLFICRFYLVYIPALYISTFVSKHFRNVKSFVPNSYQLTGFW